MRRRTSEAAGRDQVRSMAIMWGVMLAVWVLSRAFTIACLHFFELQRPYRQRIGISILMKYKGAIRRPAPLGGN